MSNRLSKQQKLFADEWLRTAKPAESYRTAYPRCKSEGAAHACASRLLKKAKVLAYVGAAKAEAAAIAQKEFAMSQRRILQEESKLVYSDIGQLFQDGTIISPDKLPEEVRRAVSGVEIIERTDNDGAVTRTYKYRFWDKGAALARMEKYLGMYEKDNLQRASVSEILEGVEEYSPELAKAVKKALERKLATAG